MVATQNFFCAGCGTPIEPSKYGKGLPAYYAMTGQRSNKAGQRFDCVGGIFDEKLIEELHNIALFFMKRPS